MLAAIAALAAQRPVVLWLEDLHWADSSTVDWFAAVAQRSAPSIGCTSSTDVGKKVFAPYTADYFFYKAAENDTGDNN